MIEAAFVILALMITTYVLLDGFDLGVGTVSPLVASDERARGATMHAIGPYWNGNEVWLIASGAVLFALFPRAYASAFSGFYLPFMVVLWLLMFRGISIEARNHFDSELWHAFWDAAFAASSALLIFILGVSLGNIVRGLPLDAHEYFFGTFALLLNPYAIGVGIFAVGALAMHGLAFLCMRGDDELRATSRPLALRSWWVVLVLYLAVSAATFAVRPSIAGRPWVVVLVVLVAAPALAGVRLFLARGAAAPAFVASSVFLATLLIAVGATIYPFLLPGFPGGQPGLTIYEAATAQPALLFGLIWTVVGLAAVVVYGVAAARSIEKGGR